jgi:hypothetical protein
MYQQLWGYKVEEKLYLGVREQKRLNTTGLKDAKTDRYDPVTLKHIRYRFHSLVLISVFTLNFLLIHLNIILSSIPRAPKWPGHFEIPTEVSFAFHMPHAYYMSHPAHPP